MSEPITILIVDDHALVREGARAFLDAQQDFTVVGDVGSGGEAVLVETAGALACELSCQASTPPPPRMIKQPQSTNSGALTRLPPRRSGRSAKRERSACSTGKSFSRTFLGSFIMDHISFYS